MTFLKMAKKFIVITFLKNHHMLDTYQIQIPKYLVQNHYIFNYNIKKNLIQKSVNYTPFLLNFHQFYIKLQKNIENIKQWYLYQSTYTKQNFLSITPNMKRLEYIFKDFMCIQTQKHKRSTYYFKTNSFYLGAEF